MGVVRDALKKEIAKDNLKYVSGTTAVIISYNHATNTAVIKYANPNGEGSLYRENVPVSNSLGGLTSGGIMAGQKCNITFVNNNIFAPIITGVSSTLYQYKTNTDQGACLVDADILEVSCPENFCPMLDSWLDELNADQCKYENDLGDYKNVNISNIVHDILSGINHYEDEEIGLTNIKTKATIKLCNNGNIDVFVSNNVGIRIGSDNKVYLYGKDFIINGQKLNDIIDERATEIAYQVSQKIVDKAIKEFAENLKTI